MFIVIGWCVYHPWIDPGLEKGAVADVSSAAPQSMVGMRQASSGH